jgi:flavin reductase (DIM6/NTAB) family NADH-FMN oxidoreductase RutF
VETAVQMDFVRPVHDAKAFRRCLGHYATGVAIVTSRHAGAAFGMTINSFAALSLDPPLVSWSIRKSSGKLDPFMRAGRFAINVLSMAQQELSATFARGGADTSFDDDWIDGETGCPLLADAIAQFECVTEQTYDVGDHVMFIGRVLQCACRDGDPLVFLRGQYVEVGEARA